MAQAPTTIGLDADDTLWQNEQFFRMTQERFAELLADFIGPFPDLRAADPLSDPPGPDCLGPDIATAYPAGQRLAAELRAEGAPGLVYPSVRHPGGTCLAAFRPAVVQNVRQGALWRLTWRGEAEPEVGRVGG